MILRLNTLWVILIMHYKHDLSLYSSSIGLIMHGYSLGFDIMMDLSCFMITKDEGFTTMLVGCFE